VGLPGPVPRCAPWDGGRANTLRGDEALAPLLLVDALDHELLQKRLITHALYSRFDIAGTNNVGYVATASDRRPGAELYRVNVQTGATMKLGTIGPSAHTVTGLAAAQDTP
jgi:Domain of unknown function (DUF4394)